MSIYETSISNATLFPYYKAELTTENVSILQYPWFNGENGIVFGCNVSNTNIFPLMHIREILQQDTSSFLLPWYVNENDLFIFLNGVKLIHNIDYVLSNANKQIDFIGDVNLKKYDYLTIYNFSVKNRKTQTFSQTYTTINLSLGFTPTNTVNVYKNGVLLASTDYSINSSTLTLSNIYSGDVIECIEFTSNMNVKNISLVNNVFQYSISPIDIPSNETETNNKFLCYINGIKIDYADYELNYSTNNDFIIFENDVIFKTGDFSYSFFSTNTYVSTSNSIFTISPGVVIMNNTVIYLSEPIQIVVPLNGNYYIAFYYYNDENFLLPIIGVFDENEISSSHLKLAYIVNGTINYVYTNQRELKRISYVGEYNSNNIEPLLNRELSQGAYLLFVESRNTVWSNTWSNEWNDTENIAKLKIYDGQNWIDIIDFSNAQRLDNLHARMSDEPLSIVARDSNSYIYTKKYISTTTSESPIQVNSSYKVDKLNVDLLDNRDSKFFANIYHDHYNLKGTVNKSIYSLRWKDYILKNEEPEDFKGYLAGGINSSNVIQRFSATYYGDIVTISPISTQLSNNYVDGIAVHSNINGYFFNTNSYSNIEKFSMITENKNLISFSVDSYFYERVRLNSISSGYIIGGRNSSNVYTNRIYAINYNDDKISILYNYLITPPGINTITFPSTIGGSVGIGTNTHGYIISGRNTSSTLYSKIDKFIYDTETFVNIFTSIASLELHTGVNSPTVGYIVGGKNSSGSKMSTIYTLNFKTDTYTINSNNLLTSRYSSTGISSFSIGYIVGGYNSADIALSSIEGIRFYSIGSDLMVYNLAVSLSNTNAKMMGIQNSGIF